MSAQQAKPASAGYDIEIYFASREFRTRNAAQAERKILITRDALEQTYRDSRGRQNFTLGKRPAMLASGFQQWCFKDQDSWNKAFAYHVSVLES